MRGAVLFRPVGLSCVDAFLTFNVYMVYACKHVCIRARKQAALCMHIYIYDGVMGRYVVTQGEVNAITDDGINYTMQVWVVPPAYTQALREQAAVEAAQAGFTRPAPP